ncbi:hypothetical protein PCE1_004506 [Barthelona sp. PCE]
MLDIEDIPFLACAPSNASKPHSGSSSSIRNGKNTSNIHLNFELDQEIITEAEAVAESQRCLHCSGNPAPCSLACPSNINVRAFISAISSRDFYAAAKILLSDSPCAASTGYICPAPCRSGCNLEGKLGGPIRVRALQAFVMDWWSKQQIEETKPKSIYDEKIGLVGSGPASLSCATYLARLGYHNITIYEASDHAGGRLSTALPRFRLPLATINEEVHRVRNLGVEIRTNTRVDLEDLEGFVLQENLASLFVGVGSGRSRLPQSLQGAIPADGWLKLAIEDINKAHDIVKGKRVLVLGAGDTALDCARTALRLECASVGVVARRGVLDFRATKEDLESAQSEGVELYPNTYPQSIDGDKLMCKHFFRGSTGEYEIGEFEFPMAADVVIVAFGFSHDSKIMHKHAGGDVIGTGTVVEAVGAGKQGAINIHASLREIDPSAVELPMFTCLVDEVDISTEICGVKFPTPFGLASAPPTTGGNMIGRAFKQGFGFAVIKTMTEDDPKRITTNVSPRIGSMTGYGLSQSNRNEFLNIELLTEKTPAYWKQKCVELKEAFPEAVVIASLSTVDEKEAWQNLILDLEEAPFDMYEANFSCPHSGDKGTGIALGQDPESVERITRFIKEVATKPVFIKLTPNITDITEVAAAAVRGGCDGISTINTISALLKVDDEGIPWPNVKGKASYGGLSGNSIRPVALRMISSIRSRFPELPILGIGGVEGGNTAAELISVGSNAVQMSSILHNEGYSKVFDMIYGLKWRTYKHGEPILNRAMKHLVPGLEHIERSYQVKAEIDNDKCIGCLRCLQTCADCGYQAIFSTPELKPIITDQCMGCTLCCSCCPTGAISMIQKHGVHTINRGTYTSQLTLE